MRKHEFISTKMSAFLIVTLRTRNDSVFGHFSRRVRYCDYYHLPQRLPAIKRIRVSSLLSSLNDAFVDIIDDEGSFMSSPEAEFMSTLYVYISPCNRH